jgi:DNA-binding CsgD family transcriptional regulator
VLGDLDKLDLPLASPVSVAILDTNGVIVAVNEAWKNMGRRSSLRIPKFGVGANYLDYCTYDPAGFTKLADELRALLARRISVVTRVYPCNSPTERRWFFLIGLPLAGHDRSGIALLHINLTPFLALSIGQGAEVTPDGVGRQIDFAAVADSVEESSLEALASQVIQMLGVKPEPKRQQAEQRARQALDLAGLSKRQLEILGLLAQGKTNTEIARELSRSPHTIKLHVSAILKHLQVKSRTQAALLASKLADEDAEQG